MESAEDKKSSEKVVWTFWKKRRYIVAILSCIGCFASYLLRVNLSIAIVDMTETKNITLINGTNIRFREFDWDTRMQGYILSSFFYGYASTQLIGGYLGAKLGGKVVFGTGIAITAFLTILTPWVAKTNPYLFIALRALEGLGEGISTPCIYEIWSKWAPPLERTRLLAFTYAGIFSGSVVGMPLSGFLVNSFGWASAFYSFGVFGLLWYIIWMWVVADTPQQDTRITYSELKYITESLESDKGAMKIKDVPWRKIITSIPVWATIVAHFSENWGYYTLLTQLPKYMKRVLKFDLNASGFISGLPYLVLTVTFQISAQLADYILKKKFLSTTRLRKIFTCTGFLIQTIFMTTAIFWTTTAGTITCLTIAVGLGAVSWSGFSVSYLDFAPKYASIILGLGNTFGSLPGVLSPILTGHLVTNEHIAEEWRTVFSISSSIYLLGAIVYGIFASSELQSWAVEHVQISANEGQDETLM